MSEGASVAKPMQHPQPSFMSGDCTFFTFFPREIRDEIYSQVLLSCLQMRSINTTFKKIASVGPLPYLATQLPHCLRLNHQTIQEATTENLRRTSISVDNVPQLESLMAGLPCSAWKSIRRLRVEDAIKSAETVQNILTRCVELKRLDIYVVGRMSIATDWSFTQDASLGKMSRFTATRISGYFAHVFQHTSLRELCVRCIEFSDVRYCPDSSVESKEAYRAWEKEFAEHADKEGRSMSAKEGGVCIFRVL
jgi:hypothetical protein